MTQITEGYEDEIVSSFTFLSIPALPWQYKYETSYINKFPSKRICCINIPLQTQIIFGNIFEVISFDNMNVKIKVILQKD